MLENFCGGSFSCATLSERYKLEVLRVVLGRNLQVGTVFELFGTTQCVEHTSTRGNVKYTFPKN